MNQTRLRSRRPCSFSHFASRACFEEIAHLTGNVFGLEKKGLLCLCRTKRRWEEEARIAQQAMQLGLKVEVFDARQAARLDPNVRMDIAGAVYFHEDCHLTPARFMAPRAFSFSPIRRVTSGGGPMNLILQVSATSAKFAFSARRP